MRDRRARPLSSTASGQSFRKLMTRVAVGDRASSMMDERERSRRRSEAGTGADGGRRKKRRKSSWRAMIDAAGGETEKPWVVGVGVEVVGEADGGTGGKCDEALMAEMGMGRVRRVEVGGVVDEVVVGGWGWDGGVGLGRRWWRRAGRLCRGRGRRRGRRAGG